MNIDLHTVFFDHADTVYADVRCALDGLVLRIDRVGLVDYTNAGDVIADLWGAVESVKPLLAKFDAYVLIREAEKEYALMSDADNLSDTDGDFVADVELLENQFHDVEAKAGALVEQVAVAMDDLRRMADLADENREEVCHAAYHIAFSVLPSIIDAVVDYVKFIDGVSATASRVADRVLVAR